MSWCSRPDLACRGVYLENQWLSKMYLSLGRWFKSRNEMLPCVSTAGDQIIFLGLWKLKLYEKHLFSEYICKVRYWVSFLYSRWLFDYRYLNNIRIPDDCVSKFDKKTCQHIVHKKDDPSTSCPILAASGKWRNCSLSCEILIHCVTVTIVSDTSVF